MAAWCGQTDRPTGPKKKASQVCVYLWCPFETDNGTQSETKQSLLLLFGCETADSAVNVSLSSVHITTYVYAERFDFILQVSCWFNLSKLPFKTAQFQIYTEIQYAFFQRVHLVFADSLKFPTDGLFWTIQEKYFKRCMHSQKSNKPDTE